MKTTDEMVLFWDGPFSQWEPCSFVIDGIEYNCAEQWMMAEKARFFGDEETLDLIMETDDPREQKKLGRQVEDFNEEEWDEVVMPIVIRGNMAKFGQNPELKKILLGTEDRIIVEASPTDNKWGIGLRERGVK